MIHIDTLSKTFSGGKGLDRVSLHIKPGEMVALIGSSGSGKSTLMRHIAGLMPGDADGGRIEVAQHLIQDRGVISRDIRTMRAEIGMVFQQPIAFPHSIEKNLTYVLKYYGIRDKKVLSEKVEESLKKAKLYEEVKDQLKKSALKLSGGQKQRLAIARSLCVNPEILLLDEPCSALDMKNTIAIEETLMELKGQYTFVIVTHNLGQAKRIADQIIFMDQGKILEVTDKETFFDSPATELAREQIQYM